MLLQIGTSILHRNFLSTLLFRWVWVVYECSYGQLNGKHIHKAEYWAERHTAQWQRLNRGWNLCTEHCWVVRRSINFRPFFFFDQKPKMPFSADNHRCPKFRCIPSFSYIDSPQSKRKEKKIKQINKNHKIYIVKGLLTDCSGKWPHWWPCWLAHSCNSDLQRVSTCEIWEMVGGCTRNHTESTCNTEWRLRPIST